MKGFVLTYHSHHVVGSDYARNDHIALAADLELIAVKKTAIVVVKAESVSRSQGQGAIGLAQEEQIPVFYDNRFRDVAVDGMNFRDEIRICFSNGGVDRSSECVPGFSHDLREEINALLQMPAWQNFRSKSAPKLRLNLENLINLISKAV